MELVVLSGKGGTGKTTVATAISELARKVMRIDCDVDAPNMYLFYENSGSENILEEDFMGSKKAVLFNEKNCIECGKCQRVCRFGAIKNNRINPMLCEGCGACVAICPEQVLRLEDEKTAEVYMTKLQEGIISRAQMEVGSDGSGKLITHLRKNGKQFLKDEKFTIIDGSPGIGCPVISSITGSDAVLIVTEPTKSGLLDLARVVTLCEYFGIFTMGVINKFDINSEVSMEIEEFLKQKNIPLVGVIPYDETVMNSINELRPITQYEDSPAAKSIKLMWDRIKKEIFNN